MQVCQVAKLCLAGLDDRTDKVRNCEKLAEFICQTTKNIGKKNIGEKMAWKKIHTNAFESLHDKTNKMACAPSEDSDQPGHPPSLIRVFAVRTG